MIDDQNCDVGLPNFSGNKHEFGNSWSLRNTSSPPAPLLILVQVGRFISQVLKALRPSLIPTPTLNALDTELGACMSAFPMHHQISMTEYLDPSSLSPIVYLQSARIMLHRHNLSPTCTPEVRTAAIDSCVHTAKDTVKFVSRTMQEPPQSPSRAAATSDTWTARISGAASAFLCTHIWRCALFLCFRGEYSAALTCARVSAAIGSARPINNACGRHLDFFLQCLLTRLHRGQGTFLERDEEMVAYVSGDLQGNVDGAWIWQGGGDLQDQRDGLRSQGSNSTSESVTLSPIQDESKDWVGWDGIITMLQRLMHEQQQQQQQNRLLPGRQPLLQGEALYFGPQLGLSHPTVSPGGSHRISIANII